MSTKPLKIGETEIKTIYDLLDLIRQRPGMWIGEPSTTRLSIFIQAFVAGVHAAHRSLDAESPAFQGFHEWIAARLGRRKNGYGWSEMLLESTNGNEQAAFDRFWTEFDVFRAQ